MEKVPAVVDEPCSGAQVQMKTGSLLIKTDTPNEFSDKRATLLVMGFQHLFVMFGATVLVPIITGLSVSVALFASGIGTLIFHLLTERKVPVYLGSSFAFIPAILAISTAPGGSLNQACGAIVIAGIFYLLIAIIFRAIGFRRIQRLLPPHVTGPMIVLIGLILAPVAVHNACGLNDAALAAEIGADGCWGIALFTLAFGIFVKIALARWGFRLLSTLPVLLALLAGYLLSLLCGIIDFTQLRESAWLGLPPFTRPEFRLSAIFIAVPVALVTIVEHFGDILAIGNVVRKNFIASPGIHRTLIGDGLATAVSAMIGGPANTTYSENTGAVALTGNYNPRVMRIAAVFAIAFSLIPKFGAVIASVPTPVVGGISILLFGMIASIGIKTMVDARVDMQNPRILIVTAAMLVLGLGGAEFSRGVVRLSGLGLAAIVGILLNLILGVGESAPE